jgi:hypothetical protein
MVQKSDLHNCCRTQHVYPNPRYPAVACRAVAGRTASAPCFDEWDLTGCIDYEDLTPCERLCPKSAVLGKALLGCTVLGTA